jgi:hypothetical protein
MSPRPVHCKANDTLTSFSLSGCWSRHPTRRQPSRKSAAVSHAQRSKRVPPTGPPLRATCPDRSNPTIKRHFASLAKTWINLADDLERSQTFHAALAEADAGLTLLHHRGARRHQTLIP